LSIDAKLYAPATERNRVPILYVLRRHLPKRGLVLEIASGSGEHVVHFAAALGPGLVFQPSDPDGPARASIDAWVASAGVGNVRPAIALDASREDWPIAEADAVLCINMIHISLWTATIGLMRGAARVLRASVRPGQGTADKVLYLYGPYKREGRHTAPSNDSFDAGLRERNPLWGVRDIEAVSALAAEHGFGPPAIEAMPANNLSVIFRLAR
jgi:hypothetical protein